MKKTSLILLNLLFFSALQAQTITQSFQGQTLQAHERSVLTKLPYPILFVHGWNGDHTTFATAEQTLKDAGMVQGGLLPYCLNMDDNINYSNIFQGKMVDMQSFFSSLEKGDFYNITFNTNPNGDYKNTNSVNSNREAIRKQAFAISNAITNIIAVNSASDVIIVAHSMGGLAAREYLQNSIFYQNDGKHHLAKLITMATPHQGITNAANLIGISNALRDMTSNSIFLNGGNENDVPSGFSKDVSCNGFDGNTVTGLNQRSFPSVEVTCAMVEKDGDEIVDEKSSQLKNVYSYIRNETFYSPSGSITDHSKITTYPDILMNCLDETEYFDRALSIEIGKGYNGFITEQADDAQFQDEDYDDYSFTVNTAGKYRLTAGKNTGLPTVTFDIYKENSYDIPLQSSRLSAGGTQKYYSEIYLNKGKYFVEAHAVPTSTSWQQGGYWFAMEKIGSATATEDIQLAEISVFPNPTADYFRLSDPSIAEIQWSSITGEILGVLSQQNGHFDISSYPSGIYIAKANNKAFKIVKK